MSADNPLRGKTLRTQIVARLLAVDDASIRLAWLGNTLRGEGVEIAALALDALCLDAEQADPSAREVLLTLVHVVQDDLELGDRLREEAAGASLLGLARLLRRPLERPSAGSSRRRLPDAPIPDYGTGRQLTLGERKALARRPSRAAFDKLLLDPHPDVITTLLRNPRLTEDDVIALAARRPARTGVLQAIARSTKWALRPRVRMAIVLHPGAPAEIAVPMVSLLVRHELRVVVEVTEAQHAVRAAAREILLRRPPTLGDEDDGVVN